jgi:apolipoprotein N-acyltransferase
MMQPAALVGAYGLGLLTVIAAAAPALLFEPGLDRAHRLAGVAAALALLAGLWFWGAERIAGADPRPVEGVRLRLVQGNIEQSLKWDESRREQTFAHYIALTRRPGFERITHVIWPETATPFYFEGSDAPSPALTDELRRFVRSAGTPLLFGSPTDEKKEGRHNLRNSAFLLDRSGETAARYHKIHLVPFGEYVPLKNSLLFFVKKIVQAGDDFQAGAEHTVMKVRLPAGDDVAIGTVICYEIIFPDLVRRFVNEGAAVITTVTNDAWFGRTGAPYQHFSMAVLRAVENRVPVARAANTGISGFIDARGRILDASGIFTEAVLTRSLIPGSTKTCYTRYGDVFSWLCVLGTILAVVPLPRFK